MDVNGGELKLADSHAEGDLLKTNLKVDVGKPNVGRRRVPSLLLLIHGHGHKPHYDEQLLVRRR